MCHYESGTEHEQPHSVVDNRKPEATMKTRDTQGSFIILIWTLIAKVKEVISVGSVSIHPRADVVAGLFLLPVVTRSIQRRQAEEAGIRDRVFRFSSDGPTFPCWSGGASRIPSR